MSKNAHSERSRPWLMRTYAGHSTATESNLLFKKNLAKGQTGLSVAFDLPTQTGYDSDHPLAKGEVGKVGVPIAHLGDMRALFDGIDPALMNTSMTINATAPWLYALYVALSEERGADVSALAGTTQNDLMKEYLSRGTYIFPPEPSLKLTADLAAYAYKRTPKWNPLNVCSYHLQEAGATPEQELAFALATAIATLDAVRATPEIGGDDFPGVVGRMSFFVNAGLRFITEMCKMRAFVDLWDEITRERYGVDDLKMRRFRYGVQVNSLGLTEQQPENNVARILLEMLAVTLSKDARARAVQLPAWNEALGLPRPWDQQWSLRMQQILAYETDLLDYDDIFDGSHVIEAQVEALKQSARAELAHIDAMGGAVAAIDYMKRALVGANGARLGRIESGEQIVVGVNRFTSSEDSPLDIGVGGVLVVDPAVEAEQCLRLKAWRNERDALAAHRAIEALRQSARAGENIVPPSIEAAKAGVTTGEWADALREIFGEYRGPTGLAAGSGAPRPSSQANAHDDIKARVEAVSDRLGRRLKFLVGKPGLDGHSNGAEQIALRARDCGMEVVYEGIRLTPARIAAAALEEGAHIVGLSVLSGSHMTLIGEVLKGLRDYGLQDTPVIVGGVIPEEDAQALRAMGAARVYTPKDFDLSEIMSEIVTLAEQSSDCAA